MKKLYVMCGVPGMGKSTWIRNNVSKMNGLTHVVSRDDIRFSKVKEGEDYFSKENEVFKEYIEDIKESLTYCDNTIADATHLNPASRGKLFRNLGSSLDGIEVIAIVIKGSLDKALTQNELRKETRSYVPQSVIRRMNSSFEMPILEEGFDKIFIY